LQRAFPTGSKSEHWAQLHQAEKTDQDSGFEKVSFLLDCLVLWSKGYPDGWLCMILFAKLTLHSCYWSLSLPNAEQYVSLWGCIFKINGMQRQRRAVTKEQIIWNKTLKSFCIRCEVVNTPHLFSASVWECKVFFFFCRHAELCFYVVRSACFVAMYYYVHRHLVCVAQLLCDSLLLLCVKMFKVFEECVSLYLYQIHYAVHAVTCLPEKKLRLEYAKFQGINTGAILIVFESGLLSVVPLVSSPLIDKGMVIWEARSKQSTRPWTSPLTDVCFCQIKLGRF
jgi:hypothetical protein